MRISKSISIKYRVGMAFFAVMLPVAIFLCVYVSDIISGLNKEVAQAGLSTLKIFCTSLENEMNHVESFLIDTALNNSSFHALNEPMKKSDAYLNGYNVKNMFVSIINANPDISSLLIYSSPNELTLAEFGTMEVSNTVDRALIKDQIRANVVSLLQSEPINTERWFAMEIGGRQFWVRIVRYYSSYVVSLIDLKRLVDIAPSKFNLGGSIAFLYSGKLLTEGLENTSIEWKQLEDDYYMAGGFKKQYLVMQQSVGELLVSYVVQNKGLWYLSVFQVLFIAFTIFVILAVPYTWLYLRRNFFRPLDGLVYTMEKIKKGDLTAQPDDAYKSLEFRQVNETFNSMIKEITRLKIDSYEKQLLAERAEMEALKMQIRPHFFLNCLKSLYALAEAKQTADIQNTILKLSNHLRYVFSNTNDTVPLKKELQLCQNYIELQNICKLFPTEFQMNVDASLMQMLIPTVSLLTLVENSIKYGVKENQPLVIRISIRKLLMEDENLVNITVSDNGPGFSIEKLAELNQNLDEARNQGHVGLANTIRRFKLLFGSKFAASFINKDGAQVELFITINNKDAKGGIQ